MPLEGLNKKKYQKQYMKDYMKRKRESARKPNYGIKNKKQDDTVCQHDVALIRNNMLFKLFTPNHMKPDYKKKLKDLQSMTDYKLKYNLPTQEEINQAWTLSYLLYVRHLAGGIGLNK